MDASHERCSSKFISDMPLEDKKSFYEQIDELGTSIKEDDQFFDPLRQQGRAFFKGAKPGSEKRPTHTTSTTTCSVTSSASFTSASNRLNTGAVHEQTSTVIEATPSVAEQGNQRTQRRKPISTSFVQDTPGGPGLQPTTRLKGTQTTPNASIPGFLSSSAQQQVSSTMVGKNNGKRSLKGKAKNAEVIPEEEQHLKGLRLFYIPGERIKLRKQRMERAEGHGALVTRELSEATHVVVDEDLTYDDIKTHVSAILGQLNPAIVTDQWPLECIERKYVFPPSRKYRPKGLPTGEPAPVPETGLTVSGASNGSLELKTTGNKRNRWDYVSPETTQSGTSSIRPADRAEAHRELSQPGPEHVGEANVISSPSAAQLGEGKTGHEFPQGHETRRSNSEFGDELAQIVHQAREDFKDVPRIGEDDANDHREGDKAQVDDSGTDEEREKKRRKKDAARKMGKQMRGNEKFRCHTGGTIAEGAGQENPNAMVISVLKKMAEYYTQTNDRWRPIAYRRAITELEGITDRRISTAEEAMELPCFGPRLADKLEEIVNTHSLARLDYALKEPMSKIEALFLGIYGVGKSTADKWIAQGFRTLDDLLQGANLTDNQKMGLDHYEDLNTRIPREEVTKLGEHVKGVAAKIDPNVHLIIGGSYRRGADTSGDIDFIITKKGTSSSKELVPFLDKLVGDLWRQGFLTAEVASNSSHRDSGGSKWHGCCVLPRIPELNDDANYRPVWRRIDMLLVPHSEYGAALIYFTGNDIFNRSLRMLASRKGMRLNQRGLYKDVITGPGREKITEGELVEGKDEKRIFEILDVKWREPHERWC